MAEETAQDSDPEVADAESDEESDDESMQSSVESTSDVTQEDDVSVVSSIDSAGSEDDTNRKVHDTPRQDWEYVPEMTRQALLQLICDKGSSAEDDLVVVQVAKRGESVKDTMKHFFLVVPEIISKGKHEGRIIPSTALFVLLQVHGMNVYDDNGKLAGEDETLWDVYAQASTHTASDGPAIQFWAVDESGSHVAKVIHLYVFILQYLDNSLTLWFVPVCHASCWGCLQMVLSVASSGA